MHIKRNFELVNRADRPDLLRAGRRVHYLHVPKCGGTTLRYVLEAYAATRRLSVANEARRANGAPDLEAAQIAMGHIPPREGLTRADTCYVTVLRDPVLRLRSLVGMIASRHKREPEAVVRQLAWTQANWAVHLLTGATGPAGDPASEAKRVLESRIHLFGFQEQSAGFMALLAAMLDLDGLIYPVFQYTPHGRRVQAQFDDDFLALSRDDRSLYDFALQLYQERFAASAPTAIPHERIPGRQYLCIRPQAGSRHVDVSEVRFTAGSDDSGDEPAIGPALCKPADPA